jgi:hypothetical protein
MIVRKHPDAKEKCWLRETRLEINQMSDDDGASIKTQATGSVALPSPAVNLSEILAR